MMNTLEKTELMDEMLVAVNGGNGEEFDYEAMLLSFVAQFLQPNGSYRFVCPNCGAVITGTDPYAFANALNEHIGSHMPDLDNVPIITPDLTK